MCLNIFCLVFLMSPYSLELLGTDFKPLYSVINLFYKKKEYFTCSY